MSKNICIKHLPSLFFVMLLSPLARKVAFHSHGSNYYQEKRKWQRFSFLRRHIRFRGNFEGKFSSTKDVKLCRKWTWQRSVDTWSRPSDTYNKSPYSSALLSFSFKSPDVGWRRESILQRHILSGIMYTYYLLTIHIILPKEKRTLCLFCGW